MTHDPPHCWMCTHCGQTFDRSPWGPSHRTHRCGDPPTEREPFAYGAERRNPVTGNVYRPRHKTEDYTYTTYGAIKLLELRRRRLQREADEEVKGPLYKGKPVSPRSIERLRKAGYI